MAWEFQEECGREEYLAALGGFGFWGWALGGHFRHLEGSVHNIDGGRDLSWLMEIRRVAFGLTNYLSPIV